MGVRRRARECALMILYSVDLAGRWADTATARFFESFADDPELDPPPPWAADTQRVKAYRVDGSSEVKDYAARLVEGVERNAEQIDATIQSISRNWRLQRMAIVDRNVLRLATYELTHLADEVPRKVAINEAIDVAKRFGTAESGAFVNGILDRIGKDR